MIHHIFITGIKGLDDIIFSLLYFHSLYYLYTEGLISSFNFIEKGLKFFKFLKQYQDLTKTVVVLILVHVARVPLLGNRKMIEIWDVSYKIQLVYELYEPSASAIFRVVGERFVRFPQLIEDNLFLRRMLFFPS